MKPLCLRKVMTESRRHEVKIFKGIDSKVIGLKLEGSSAESFYGLISLMPFSILMGRYWKSK